MVARRDADSGVAKCCVTTPEVADVRRIRLLAPSNSDQAIAADVGTGPGGHYLISRLRQEVRKVPGK